MTRKLPFLLIVLLFLACNEEFNDTGIEYDTPAPLQENMDYQSPSEGGFEKVTEIDYKDESSGKIAGADRSHIIVSNVSGDASYASAYTQSAADLNGEMKIATQGTGSLNQKPKPQDSKKKSKIIWSAGLDFQVSNVDSATSVIGDIAALNDGFISEMNKTQDNKRINNAVTLKVNSENFQKTINALKKLSIHLSSERINSQDVTKEFIDAESRLKTKQEVLERYKDILRTRTGKIEEVLEAEEKIRKLTEEIEAKKGYLRYLTDRVKYSRIQLKIYEKVEYKEDAPIIYEKTFGDKALAGFGNGWEWIQNFLLLMITLWPLLLMLAVVLIWKRKWLKKNVFS